MSEFNPDYLPEAPLDYKWLVLFLCHKDRPTYRLYRYYHYYNVVHYDEREIIKSACMALNRPWWWLKLWGWRVGLNEQNR